jgi:hypothetical protein
MSDPAITTAAASTSIGPGRRPPLAGTDWIVMAAIFLGCLALRAPFRSGMAYHWDSAQFAIAVRDYNVALSQPHAPGYFLYVALGRLLDGLLADPHASLVWVSVVFSSGLPALMYLLGHAMFGRRVAIAAATVAATSPQTWFHGCVALTYVVDALLVCATVWWCWRIIQTGGAARDAVVLGVLLGVVGGVRQQTVPALLPVVLFAWWRARGQRFANAALTLAVAGGVGLTWFVPTLNASGGLAMYLEIVRRHAAFNAPATLVGGGVNALLENLALIAVFLWCGLLAAALVLLAGLIHRAWRMAPGDKQQWTDRHRLQLQLLAVWIAPMMLAGAIGFTKQPGYVLGYLPGFILLAAATIGALQPRATFVAVTATVCLFNVAVFGGWLPGADKALLGVGLSAGSIRQHDRQLADTIALIRSRYSPASSVVCHAHQYYLFGFRHFQLHLPEFDHYLLERDPTVVTSEDAYLWRSRNGRLDFVSDIDLTSRETVLLIVPAGQQVGIFAGRFDVSATREVTGSGGTVHEILLGGTGAGVFRD